MGQASDYKKKGWQDSSGGNVASGAIVRRSYVGDDWENDKPLLYISGPMLSEGNPYTNIRKAVIVAGYARQMGWAVIIPHLDCLFAMISGIKDSEYYIDNDLNQLERCDALLVLPFKVEYKDGNQCGTSIELDFAEDRNIPIYTCDSLPTAEEFDKLERE